jgi:hypothetical protein
MSGGGAGGGHGADALLPASPTPSTANSNARELQASDYPDSLKELKECVGGEATPSPKLLMYEAVRFEYMRPSAI